MNKLLIIFILFLQIFGANETIDKKRIIKNDMGWNVPTLKIKPINKTEIFLNQNKIKILEYIFDNEFLLKQTLVPEYNSTLKEKIDCNVFEVEYINEVTVYVLEGV